MNEIINSLGVELIGLILRIIGAVLGVLLLQIAHKYINTEEKRAIVKAAVLFVEQVCQDLHGADKFQRALEIASENLKKYHINIGTNELREMIEAAVGEMNLNRVPKKDLLPAEDPTESE